MHIASLTPRRPVALDVCEHCGRTVDRVWLVPGDVLDSCRDCFAEQAGHQPVHAQGHSTEVRLTPTRRPAPTAGAFYTPARGRRSA